MQGKDRKIWQNYQRIMSLLQSFIDKNRFNVSYIQKITKMSFNIPLSWDELIVVWNLW
jgi:flagellar biosynthesis chaperone FliJ